MPEICYRALLYPGPRNRWNAGVFNSYHPTPHPHWQGIWAQKELANPGAAHEAEDFPLAFDKGVYSQQARTNYLHLMRAKGAEGWTQAELDSASEVAGVSAFNGADGPTRVYAYAASSDQPEHISRIATFMGEVICELPEGGGVIVRNVEPTGPPVTTEAFRLQHGLALYTPRGAE